MGVEEDFAAAAEDISNNVNKTLTDDELKEVYALYKQGTIGDVNTSRCNMVFDHFFFHTIIVQAGHAGLQGQGQVGRVGGKEGNGFDRGQGEVHCLCCSAQREAWHEGVDAVHFNLHVK